MLSPGVVVEAGASVKNGVLLDAVHVHAEVSLENSIADLSADIFGGNRRANATSVTLIGNDGLMATCEDFDHGALLPQDF